MTARTLRVNSTPPYRMPATPKTAAETAALHFNVRTKNFLLLAHLLETGASITAEEAAKAYGIHGGLSNRIAALKRCCFKVVTRGETNTATGRTCARYSIEQD